MRDRPRAILLRVVPLLAAAAAVAAVGALAVGLSGDRHDGRAAPRAVAAAQPDASAAAAPADRVGESQAPRGTTAFVRRLEIGADLMGLIEEVEEKGIWAARFADRLDRLRPFLLAADGEPKERERPTRTLLRLTEPRRDLSSLILAGAARDDPTGSSMRVRVWTIKEPYPDAERARVAATIDHIARTVGRDVEGGIDVLVTAGMGSDVFPFQRTNWYAAGIYFLQDKYCVVRAKLPEDRRPEVVEHECIHAYHRSLPAATDRRFIGEGLSEYLRLVEPGDQGLRVPRERLADHFAELQLILRRLKEAGVGIEKIDPRRLVELSPKDFYALRHVGYLVAQAAMAYVGGDAIQHALAGDSDTPLIRAVRGILWADFLRFVNEGAVGGTVGRAFVVEDVTFDWSWRSRESFVHALRAVGADVPESAGALNPTLAEAQSVAGLEAEIERFLEALAEAPWIPRLYVDLSASMDRSVRLAPAPEAVTRILKGVPRGETPRHFAREFLRLLAAGRSVEVVGLSKERRVGGAEVLDAVDALELGTLEAGATPAILIVIVGSDGVGSKARSLADKLGSIVLIVDLTEDAEGVEIARLCDEKRLVAYWRPIAAR